MEPSPRLLVEHGAASAHALLRAAAAQFHEVAPEEIVVVHECPRCGSDAHGRPRLLATARLRHPAQVSIARAGALSVVAITDAGPVGVDVEVEGAAGAARIEDAVLHPGERATEPADLTRTWVRKEALLKAYGLGLVVDPRDVHLDEHGLLAWDSRHPRPRAVWLRDLPLPGHVVAVAVLPSRDQDVDGLTATVAPAMP